MERKKKKKKPFWQLRKVKSNLSPQRLCCKVDDLLTPILCNVSVSPRLLGEEKRGTKRAYLPWELRISVVQDHAESLDWKVSRNTEAACFMLWSAPK